MPNPKSLRVAVLGGGGVGSCTALELASHGCHVDLYEQDGQPLTRASRVNEGKIHRGFLYAHDRSLRTARLMVRGGLAFSACLSRWIDLDARPLHLSTPFVYVVHRNTMVDIDAVEHHFSACCSADRELRAASGLRYLGRDEASSFRKLDPEQFRSILNPAELVGAFETTEYAIDPRPVAERLRAAVLAEPRITFHGGCRVDRVERVNGRGFVVSFTHDAPGRSGPYDQVVNALWDGRLAIDHTLGIAPGRTWIFRHKFGNRVSVALKPSDLPSVTMVLGPFGDIVNFGSAGFYLSWYPFGMVATSHDMQPAPGWPHLDEAERMDVFARSFEQWSTYCPQLRHLGFSRDQVDPSSGVIFAWGDTDIDDPQSVLHMRDDVGIDSFDGYHSVNSGKYTMVPYFALNAAARVLGHDVVTPGLSETWSPELSLDGPMRA